MSGMFRSFVTLCFLMFLVQVAHADCPVPTGPSGIPSGRTATMAEMADAQRQLQAFDGATHSYLQCLNGDLSQKDIGHTEEERKALRQETIKAYSAVWVKLHWMSNCYNAELKSFRETGGGKKAVPADCSEYVARATEAASKPATAAAASNGADEAGFSEPQTLPTGAWRYRIVRGEQNVACRHAGPAECVPTSIEIKNSSRDTLECNVQLDLEGVNNEGQTHVEMPAVVPAGVTRATLKTFLPVATTVKSSTSDCKPRQPFAPLSTPKECAFQVVQTVDVPAYYPAASRRLGEEGVVALQYTLKTAEGRPTDIRVIGSSLFSRLDAAAIKAVGDMVLKTPCPGQDFRMQINFKLN